ncbi:MAG TPA: fibronectin type III domain-containing protein [bacterium]|nr:fibronectin type III domain-containing protein [bacterium]
MRRERPAGAWQEVATAVISEATLVEQPTGKELEYRIVAVNKTGDGEPSNTAMVVL